MPLLIKASSPGWEKQFKTVERARVELLKHICKACLIGGEWEDFDEKGITRGIIHIEKAPNQSDIYELLGTPCGAEFWLEE